MTRATGLSSRSNLEAGCCSKFNALSFLLPKSKPLLHGPLVFCNMFGFIFNGNANAGWEEWEPLATFVRRVSGDMELSDRGVLQTVQLIQDKVDSGEWQ